MSGMWKLCGQSQRLQRRTRQSGCSGHGPTPDPALIDCSQALHRVLARPRQCIPAAGSGLTPEAPPGPRSGGCRRSDPAGPQDTGNGRGDPRSPPKRMPGQPYSGGHRMAKARTPAPPLLLPRRRAYHRIVEEWMTSLQRFFSTFRQCHSATIKPWTLPRSCPGEPAFRSRAAGQPPAPGQRIRPACGNGCSATGIRFPGLRSCPRGAGRRDGCNG